MPEPVTALGGASFSGFAEVKECDLQGMVTLRGDLSDRKLISAVRKLTGCAVPDVGKIVPAGQNCVAWMSPDELLILLPHGQCAKTVENLSNSLKTIHHLAVNVSDARAVFTISGRGCRDVLAKLSPANLAVNAIGANQIRRTRLAQVPAAFWFSDKDVIQVICFRSVADYVFELLKTAAAPNSQVNYL